MTMSRCESRLTQRWSRVLPQHEHVAVVMTAPPDGARLGPSGPPGRHRLHHRARSMAPAPARPSSRTARWTSSTPEPTGHRPHLRLAGIHHLPPVSREDGGLRGFRGLYLNWRRLAYV